jgi:hypothetical protein
MIRYLTAKANTFKCQKLGRQLSDVKPALDYLLSSLSTKTTAMLASQSPTDDLLARFKRETESLCNPLQTLQLTARVVTETIEEWSTKGTKLFGAVRQMLTAKNFAGKFEDLSADIATAIQGLQLALTTMNFLNLNHVQQQLRKLPDKSTSVQATREAAKEDQNDFSNQIQVLMKRDAEFKRELEQHWNEISSQMKSQFGDLHTYLDGEFHKVHKKMDSIHEDVIEIRRMMLQRLEFRSILWSELILDQKAGQGGFGTVFKAQWGNRGVVAVKTLLLEGTGSRVLREIEAELRAEAEQLNKVASPHVVELKGVVFESPKFAIVMEFAAPDLSFFLGDIEPSALSWGQRFCMAKQVALGLAAVHRAKV